MFDDVLPLLIVGDSLVAACNAMRRTCTGPIRAQNAWGAGQSVARHEGDSLRGSANVEPRDPCRGPRGPD